jgi:hypothetical protein
MQILVRVRAPKPTSEMPLLRRLYWLTLLVNLAALTVDAAILARVQLPTVVVLSVAFVPFAASLGVTRLCSTDRRNRLASERLQAGLLGLRPE